MIDFEEIIALRDEKNKQKVRYAKRRKDAQKKARHRASIYQECSNFSGDSLLKYSSHLKKGFLTGSFHPAYERKYAEDHSNCRNRLSVAYQRTLTIAESKLNDYFCCA